MPYFGVCYSPYYRTAALPPYDVPESQIETDMALIAAKFSHIRTYSCQSGDRWNVSQAARHGLKVGLGVWVVPGQDQNNRAAIESAWEQASAAQSSHQNQTVVDLVIGNEVNRTDTGVYQPNEIASLMNHAMQTKPKDLNTRVTTCFSGTVLQSPNSPWIPVVQKCQDVVYLTVYPWYGKGEPNNIKPNMDWSWNNGLSQVVALGKRIIIAEIGWPSQGGRATSRENEQINFGVTKTFLSGQTSPHWALDAYWFEMFDEPWKTNEGPWGPYWGLYTSGPNPKPKLPFSDASARLSSLSTRIVT